MQRLSLAMAGLMIQEHLESISSGISVFLFVLVSDLDLDMKEADLK